MLSIFQRDYLVPNIHYTLLTYRNNLHTKAANILPSSRINIPVSPQRAIWLRGMRFP